MFCLSDHIHIDGIGKKPCAEHHELDSSFYCGFMVSSFFFRRVQ